MNSQNKTNVHDFKFQEVMGATEKISIIGSGVLGTTVGEGFSKVGLPRVCLKEGLRKTIQWLKDK